MHMWSITLEKYIRSLQQAKFRKKYNKFTAEGNKICKEFVINKSLNIEYLIATKKWLEKNKLLVSDLPYKVVETTEKNIAKVSSFKNASNVLMVLEMMDDAIDMAHIKKDSAIFLDDVQDPGNVGNIIRIAAWFGFAAVIRSIGSADFYNPKVVQSSMGTLTRVALHSSDIDTLSETEINIYGADTSGEDVYALDKLTPGILVIGNEGKGMQERTKKKLSKTLRIPSYGKVESLNAAVACGILCAEMKVQR